VYNQYPFPLGYGVYPYPGYETTQQRLERASREAYLRSPEYLAQQRSPQQPLQEFVAVAVDSEEAARNHPLDFSGGLQIFLDRGTGRVYLKQINPGTGLLDFDVYEKTTTLDPQSAPAVDKLDVLLQEVRDLKEAFKNAQIDPD